MYQAIFNLLLLKQNKKIIVMSIYPELAVGRTYNACIIFVGCLLDQHKKKGL